MLGVGMDWAESFHDAALGVPGKGVTEQFRIDHGPAGVPAAGCPLPGAGARSG